MGQSAPHHLDSTAYGRLQRDLDEEHQRVKDVFFNMTRVDPDAEPGRYQAIVSAMIDAIDRKVALDSEATDSQPAVLQPDLFGDLGVDNAALNVLIAQIRGLSSGDEQSSNRYLVLSNYLKGNLSRGSEDALAGSARGSINWEYLAAQMDDLRKRLYGDPEEIQARSRRVRGAGGSEDHGDSPAPFREDR